MPGDRDDHRPPAEVLAGRDVLERQKSAGVPRQLIGLVMDDKGVLRHGQKVLTANGDGEILSGTFSTTLGKAIAFARVPAGAPGDVRVDIRGKEVPVRVVKFPFVRDGKPQVTDGPFAETREVLGGFYLVDVNTLDEALDIAARHPGARFGAVEVRPLAEMPGLPTAD